MAFVVLSINFDALFKSRRASCRLSAAALSYLRCRVRGVESPSRESACAASCWLYSPWRCHIGYALQPARALPAAPLPRQPASFTARDESGPDPPPRSRERYKGHTSQERCGSPQVRGAIESLHRPNAPLPSSWRGIPDLRGPAADTSRSLAAVESIPVVSPVQSGRPWPMQTAFLGVYSA